MMNIEIVKLADHCYALKRNGEQSSVTFETEMDANAMRFELELEWLEEQK